MSDTGYSDQVDEPVGSDDTTTYDSPEGDREVTYSVDDAGDAGTRPADEIPADEKFTDAEGAHEPTYETGDGLVHPEPGLQAAVVGPDAAGPDPGHVGDTDREPEDGQSSIEAVDDAFKAYDFDDPDTTADDKAIQIREDAEVARKAAAQRNATMTEAGFSGAMVDPINGGIVTTGGTPVTPVPNDADPKLSSSTRQREGTARP